MGRLTRVILLGLLAAISLPMGSTPAAGVDVVALTQETQAISRSSDKMTIVWWVPEEFWQASLSEASEVTPAQVEEFLKVLRPYTVVAVVDGTIGTFGGITYRSEEIIRTTTRLVDEQGVSYAPMTDDEVDSDTKNLLQMMTPAIANVIGPMGQNMHFLLFPSKNEAGAPIAQASKKGRFKVMLGTQEFEWRLPLDSLQPVHNCPKCGEVCRGSWSYCPWCGTRIESADPPAGGDETGAEGDSTGFKIDVMPSLLSMPTPEYPESARKASVEQTVFVKALVNRDGTVRIVVVEDRAGTALEESAMVAVRQARFSPAMSEGTPVPCWVKVPVRFSLK
jgi:TonB family protein